ncbi:hypothetical protein [Maricaulis sp.]|uniref:hypothetical protein n=1 Tax=Maricaulis sp. TaxID=1486257 RepID=UPI003A8F0D3A
MTRCVQSGLPLTLLATLLVACGGDTTPPGATASGDDDGEPMVVMEQNNGGMHAQAGANLDLPAGFPEDVAHYPGLNIYGASAIPNMGYTLAALAQGSPAEVAAFYSREMAELGWTEAANAPNGPGQMLRFEKGARSISLNLIPNGDDTTLSITALN